ncbi:unnamed protein product [Allacma fusca]|uniref:Uncharacterized protein n=1 Tax=Allacma fusca TaxID=39272 RepID=A0A8J2KSC0_9HEXA|nr:unnamed protein product [Allacma fusca]
MKESSWKFCFAIIFLTCVSEGLGLYNTEKAVKTEADGIKDYFKVSEELHSSQQANHNNKMPAILKFFQSTGSVLAKINERLKSVEINVQNIKSEIKDSNSKTLAEVNRNDMHLNSKMHKLKENKTAELSRLSLEIQTGRDGLVTNISSNLNQISRLKLDLEAYTNQTGEALSQLSNKLASLEKTTNMITMSDQATAALPERYSLAVNIRNFMDSDLTDYQLKLYANGSKVAGLEYTKAPSTVPAKKEEVATFISGKSLSYSKPEGTMVYRIGGTDLFLHVYFDCWTKYRTFAAAFLSKNVPDAAIGDGRCNNSERPTGPIDSRRCHTDVTYGTTKSLLVYEENVYAKLTFKPKETTSTLTVEVFKYPLLVLFCRDGGVNSSAEATPSRN